MDEERWLVERGVIKEETKKAILTEICPRLIKAFCSCTSCTSLMTENFHMYNIRMTIFQFHRHFRFLHLMFHSCFVLCSRCLVLDSRVWFSVVVVVFFSSFLFLVSTGECERGSVFVYEEI